MFKNVGRYSNLVINPVEIANRISRLRTEFVAKALKSKTLFLITECQFCITLVRTDPWKIFLCSGRRLMSRIWRGLRQNDSIIQLLHKALLEK